VTEQDSWLAAEYKNKYSFKTCDAIIAASCALAGVEVLVTTDGCNKATKGKMLYVPSITRPDGGQMLIRLPDMWNEK
jgi:predicted nucleic acid-binding protein